MDIQYIGIDIGRGYTKAYTEIGKEKLSLMYKSVIGDVRENKVEYKYYDNSSHIEYEGRQYFIGLLAEQESYSPIRNSADSKISKTVEVLLVSVLERLAKDTERQEAQQEWQGYIEKWFADFEELLI